MTTDVLALLLRIDASTELARREIQRLDGPLVKMGDSAEIGARRFSGALQQVEKSSARLQNATRNLGFQFGDFTTQISTGTPVFQAFGQQAGQAAGALADFGGTVGKVGAFLSGPYGAIIIAATTLLGGLAAKHLLAGDAAEDQRKKEAGLTQELTKRQKLELSNPIAAAQGRAQRIIDQLPAGSVIRAQKEAEFNKRFGMNSAGLIQDGPLIEVTASRSRPSPVSVGDSGRRSAPSPAAPFDLQRETFLGGALPTDRKVAGLGFGFLEEQARKSREFIDQFNTDLGVTRDLANDISAIDLIGQSAIDASERFTDNLSRGLGQAIVNGQSLGDALVNSLKAAGAELITGGLLRLLGGGASGGGFAGVFSALGFATGGRPPVGQASIVGERGPELFVPSVPGEIIPNYKLGSAMGGGGGGSQEVMVSVTASPLLVAQVVQGSQAGTNEAIRQRTRSRMPMAAGA